MGRKLEIEVKETEAELKKLLHQQKGGRQQERVEALYLLALKLWLYLNAVRAAYDELQIL